MSNPTIVVVEPDVFSSQMIIVEPDVLVLKPDGLVVEPEIEVVEPAVDRTEAGRVTFVDFFSRFFRSLLASRVAS